MMQRWHLLVIAISLLVLCIPSVSAEKLISNTTGYNWKRFVDKIPNDAVQAGLDEEGNMKYVASVLGIPGSVRKTGNDFVFEGHLRPFFKFVNSMTINKAIPEVLCFSNPKNIAWLPGSVENVRFSMASNFVIGGNRLHYPLFIGRFKVNDTTIVGSVDAYRSGAGLYYAHHDANNVFRDADYEVLAYKESLC